MHDFLPRRLSGAGHVRLLKGIVERNLIGCTSDQTYRDSLNSDPIFLFNKMIEKGRIVGAETGFTYFKGRKTKLWFLKVLLYQVKNTWFAFEMKYFAGRNINQRIGPFVY